ncbi:hypothetical protein [Desulfatirhabdium butyrativorans]|uniref:hypothetical protein n=1 Tax=Desulfatirhabdium butyrativorans TaxID=340467 RepID=UPI00040E2349|nr:hypothetical protein [Desulfatirhabdium butyrativorans]
MSLLDDQFGIDNRCTFFFNGDWLACCVAHDIACADAYCQQSYTMRTAADIHLARCVLKRGHFFVAWFMFLACRLWAHTVWRFVYGIY